MDCFLLFCWELCRTGRWLLSRLLLDTRVYEYYISTRIMQGSKTPLNDNHIPSHISLLEVTRPLSEICQTTMRPLVRGPSSSLPAPQAILKPCDPVSLQC